MPVSTEITCDDCHTVIDAQPGSVHPALYVNYSHPQYGGAGMYYCIEGGCAEKTINALKGAPAQEQIAAAAAPAPEPAPEPTPAPEPAPSSQPA